MFSPQGSGPSSATSQLWDFGSEHLLFLNLSFPHLQNGGNFDHFVN